MGNLFVFTSAQALSRYTHLYCGLEALGLHKVGLPNVELVHVGHLAAVAVNTPCLITGRSVLGAQRCQSANGVTTAILNQRTRNNFESLKQVPAPRMKKNKKIQRKEKKKSGNNGSRPDSPLPRPCRATAPRLPQTWPYRSSGRTAPSLSHRRQAQGEDP